MGYCIRQVDCKFLMKKENQEAAFNAVKEQMDDNGYHWISRGWKKGLRDIQAVLECWLYSPKLDDETGDIVDLWFNCEKMGDEKELFKVIAPFVEKGSYLEICGEDGSKWRWIFNGKTCKTVYAEESYPENEAEDD